ncbi:hypothetical protein BJX61DRAFT_490041 [Aspergillus egyptiacus]|nr:hypothetical protein BJX61DRAFT_490041 [Aspergillus egyptiacus]
MVHSSFLLYSSSQCCAWIPASSNFISPQLHGVIIGSDPWMSLVVSKSSPVPRSHTSSSLLHFNIHGSCLFTGPVQRVCTFMLLLRVAITP